MKAIIILMFVFSQFTVFAQRAELGLSAGGAVHGGAFGSIYFKGGKPNVSPVAAVNFVFNTERYSESRITHQVGFNAHLFYKLLNESNDTFTYFYVPIGNDGKHFRYANYLLSFTPVVNWKYRLPDDVSYVYWGVALGMAGSRNVSNRRGSDFFGTSITYTAPDGGIGYCAGIHGGITKRINQRWAFNADMAFRYYGLNFAVEDKNYPGGTKFSYGTVMVPVTIGLRYRMGWQKELNSGTGKYQIIEEEVHRKKDRADTDY